MLITSPCAPGGTGQSRLWSGSDLVKHGENFAGWNRNGFARTEAGDPSGNFSLPRKVNLGRGSGFHAFEELTGQGHALIGWQSKRLGGEGFAGNVHDALH